MVGSLVHECIESYIRDGFYLVKIEEFREQSWHRLSRDEQALNADIFDLVKTLVRGWVNRWLRSGYTMLWVEKEFEVPLIPGVVFTGKIDGRCRHDDTGREWLIEHKTCKRMPSEDVRMYDVQTPLYTSVLSEIGEEPVVGVIWDYVRSKMPVKPELLKSGQLSSRKGIDTLPEIFLREIARNKLNPEGYRDVIASLNDDAFYRRIPYNVSKHQSARLREELALTAQYIQVIEVQDDWCRNLTRDCGWCDYKELCYAELRGDNLDYMLRNDYEVYDPKTKEAREVDIE